MFCYEGSQVVLARLSAKVSGRESKAFGSGGGTAMKTGVRKEVEPGLTEFLQNCESCPYPWEGDIR